MALKDLFISKTEREKRKRLARRKAFRQAERAMDTVNTEIARMRAKRDKLWDEAKAYKRDGQKLAVQRTLKSYRAQEMHISNMEMKRWGFEQILLKMRLAETDQAFASALQGLNAVQFAPPESLESTLEEIGLKADDFEDNNNIWRTIYDSEMANAEIANGSSIPSIDELDIFLEDEVVVERSELAATINQPVEQVKTNTSPSSRYEIPPSELDQKIGAGHIRLKKLLGEGR